MTGFFGLPVFSSPFAECAVPTKRHKKRRNQSAAYHRRIQKKWIKRFGTTQEKCMFVIDPVAAGLSYYRGEIAVVHPEHIAILRGI